MRFRPGTGGWLVGLAGRASRSRLHKTRPAAGADGPWTDPVSRRIDLTHSLSSCDQRGLGERWSGF
jgi:hypothetical protein